jgi:dipeptidyl aminopeptidase/acylaminoacyl peptidase
MRPALLTLLLSLFLCTSGRAQNAITVSDMQTWNEIADEQISPTGSHILYTLEKDLGDPVAVVYNATTKTERRFPRLHDAKLSYDGRYLLGLLKPSMATTKAIKLEDKKKAKDKLADLDSLLIWNLTDAQPEIIPRVHDFKIGERWAGRYAYTTKTILPDSLTKGLEKDTYRLLVRKFSNTDSFYLEGVKSYALARDANVIVAHQTARDSSWAAGILRLGPDELNWETLSEKAGDYAGLTVSNDGTRLAFMAAEKDDKDPQKAFQLYYWQDEAATATALPTAWLPAGSHISNDRKPTFSEAGDYLFFGTTPRRPERDTTLLDDEIADVEIWTTNDDRLYTEENVRLKDEEKRTYLAVYRPGQNNFLQLGTPDRPYDYQANDLAGHYAMVYDDRPYARTEMWTANPAARNTTVIDLRNGKRIPMRNGEVTPARWLDGGKHLIWYNPVDTTWNSFDPATASHHVLTTNATGVFYDEINDQPKNPGSYGYEGTLKGGDKFLVADRYDLWELDATGKAPARRITKGREQSLRFFPRQLAEEVRQIDPAQPLLVETFNQDAYYASYGWLDLRSGTHTPATDLQPKTFGSFAKAREADVYLYTRADFHEFPDLRLTTDLKTEGIKISTANPQQADFSWGTAERFTWIDNQGRTLSGLLIKPDGFNDSYEYPLMVNFYERSSEGVYRHRTPTPGRSSINYSHYASKGYVIFNPDIIYREGYPGESAYDCVMSGITALLSEGYIDRSRIGLQGHSWGGYQAAYLATKTDLFAAIEAGAPVVNMFSAYGGIRWGSGRSRQFQYEQTQSRIGGTPWTHFQRYVENSPIFTTDKINTPLLILHNDADTAVPWYQGIEWFTALRRLGKPAWMLNYRGEPHWPVKTANRFDFQTRMEQFFDHYLLGQPMPDWMTNGVAPVARGKVMRE